MKIDIYNDDLQLCYLKKTPIW